MSESAPESVTNSAPVATIATLAAHQGERVTLRGWLYNIRSSGKLLFPTFRDGTGTIQGIVPKAAVPPEVFDRIKSLTQESSVIVTGRVRADSRAPSGFELDVEDLEIVHLVPDRTPFPITPKEHGTDFLMEHRHLWVRTPRQSAILRIRATIMRAAQEYFDTNGFIRTDPPILTPAACEGTSTLFELDYFGDPAYLTQSGQLYIESTALALGKVYSFGPTFRAEKSKTRRHLTEFWMIEPEVAFMDLEGDMQLAEAFLTHIVARVLGTPPRRPQSHRPRHRQARSRHCAPALRKSKRHPERRRFSAGVEGPATISTHRNRRRHSAHESLPRLTYDEAHAMLDQAYKAKASSKPRTSTATTSARPTRPTSAPSSRSPS